MIGSRTDLLRSKWTFTAFLILTVLSIFLLTRFFEGNVFSQTIRLANRGIENMLLSAFSPNLAPDPRVVIVAIDDVTLSSEKGLGRWQDFRWEYYADAIKNLHSDGASVISLDLLLSEAPRDGGVDELTAAMKNAGNVVLGMYGAIDRSFRSGRQGTDQEIIYPVAELASAARALGYVDTPTLLWTSTVTSVVPVTRVDGRTLEFLALATLRTYFDGATGVRTEPSMNRLSTQGIYEFYPSLPRYGRIITSQPWESAMFVPYLRSSSEAFRRVSFVDVQRGSFAPGTFQDAIVIVGATATALTDRVLTPSGQQPGVYVHASVIDGILGSEYSAYISVSVEIVFIVLMTCLVAVLLMNLESRTLQIASVFFGVVVIAAFQIAVFAFAERIFHFGVEMMLIVLLIGLSVTAYKYAYEERGKRLLKNALAQYLAADLVASVLDNYEEIQLGGSRKELTIFFSDIKGFTTHSEHFAPEEVVRFLAVYLKAVSDVIIDHKGFINKYEGDAVMALWGAFGHRDDHTVLALRSALAQQQAIRHMNPLLRKDYDLEIEVRMGLNRGPAVVGNIGSVGRKIEFTAIGDAVNTASRLEWINKVYGTLICASESVKEVSGDEFFWRELDTIRVKGKGKSTTIYELVGYESEIEEEVRAKCALFSQALRYYRSGSLSLARSAFETCAREYSDVPSRAFLERIHDLEHSGLPDGWDGSWSMSEK